MILENGKYAAITKGLSPYYRKNGNLSIAIKVEAEGKELVANQHIELNDGSISESVLKNLKKLFVEWDGTIESLFVEPNFVDIACEIEVENQKGEGEYEGKTFSKIKWINPPGGGGYTADLPEAADKKELLTKYGSKFRALMGGKKPSPAPTAKQEELPTEDPPQDNPPEEAKKTTKPPAKAPAKKPTPPPAKKDANPAPTMEMCWNTILKRKPAEAETLWQKFLDEVAAGKDYDDMTADEWKAVMKLCDGTNSLE